MKKGDRVRTPDGYGTIIDDTSAFFIVQLERGGIHIYSDIELSDDDSLPVPVM